MEDLKECLNSLEDLKEYLNSKKVPLYLHETLVLGYFITKEKAYFRFAVPCYLNRIFNDDSDGSFFMIDFIAYKPELKDYELTFIPSLLPDVISFNYKDGNYDIVLEVNGEDWNTMIFSAEKTEWIPIKKIDASEMDDMEDCPYRFLQYP